MIPQLLDPYAFLVPENTPKEEIKRQVRNRLLKVRLITPFLMLVVIGILYFSIAPRLIKLYESIGVTPSFLFQYFPHIAIGILLLFVVIIVRFTEEPSYISVKTENGYLKITPQLNSSLELLTFLFLGILVGMLVLSYILSIYSLTVQLE